jgi:transcriptional regulator of aromatic amino acid metabolism
MTPRDTQYQTILNAIPIPAFVVDDDVEILDLNGAAARFCGQKREEVYRRRGGVVLHCLHANDVAEGCGRGPHCKSCVIRNSVTKCLKQHALSRKIMNLQVVHEHVAKESQVLITASPYQTTMKGWPW